MKQIAVVASVLVLVLACSPGTAWAQGHEASVSKIVRLNRAPVNKAVLRVHLPRPAEQRLANGLQVIVLERPKLPTIDFELWIKTGALADPKELPGLAEFTADMLHEGTARRTSAQLAGDVDDIGATLSASAAFGSSVSEVSASGFVEDADRILELMSDTVLHPTFPADELDKYRKRQLADLEAERSSPSFLAREKLHQVIYREFPAAVVSATPESVNRVTREDLQRFHDRYYMPDNALLGVAGDVTLNQVLPLIEKYFGGWQPHSVSQPPLGSLPLPSAFKITLVDRPGSVQTNILAGDYSLRRNDPNYIPLVVTNRILGGGPTGRLFIDLREEKGYTYGAYSFFTSDIYPGVWLAETQVRNAVTDGSMHELIAQFKRLRDEKTPEEELEEARRAIVASFALSLEYPARLLDDWMTVSYYKLPASYWDAYPAQVAKVTAGTVQQMAEKYVDLNHLQFVCVGDGKQIASVLKKYGPVETYDVNGKRED